jgi:hypothetical protein
MSKESTLYRITFANQDTIYEIYAQKVCESEMFGFLEVEGFVFGENSSLVVDPSEERLKIEFNSVKRTYIPMHAVLRIDMVSKRGVAKIRDKSSENNKVSMFPISGKRQD